MADSATLLAQLEHRLAALRKRQPDVGEALDLQELLIRTALTSARPPLTPGFPMPREQLVDRINGGVPLLHEQPVNLDIDFAADCFSRIVNELQKRGSAAAEGLDAIVHAATSGALDPHSLFTEAFVQHPQHVAALAAQANVDAELLGALTHHAVTPILAAYAEQLVPMLERADDGTTTAAVWHRGYCPVCGAWPLLAELRGVELAEYLRCAGCAAAWRWQRLMCAYCANEDFLSLRTLQIEGEQRFRVKVCNRCKGYLKIANAFDPSPPALLGLDDVASMHLDVVAMERGYLRPGGSGFAIELAIPSDEWVEELV